MEQIHGAWGDSIPQNGSYCIWAVLEFQDPPEFNLGQDDANTSQFTGLYEATVTSVMPLMEESQVIAIGSTGGFVLGEPQALPWPTSSIIWYDGNKYAKDWIENVHRNIQEAGYSFDTIFHGHYKAVLVRPTYPNCLS